MASVTRDPQTQVTGHRRSGALWLTLEGEAVRNALDGATYRQLLDHLDRAENDSAVRAVVLTGAGSAFSSGLNLKTARHEDAEQRARLADRALHRLRTFGKPTIAAVNGSAVGAGVSLVLCCDMAVASTTARFSVPEVRIGIPPVSVAPLLVAAVGPREAKRRLLLGDEFEADEARRIGVVHDVVPPGDVDAAVVRLLRDLNAAGHEAIAATKRLIEACGSPNHASGEGSRINHQEGTFRHDG